jgi:hypothetical protein
VLKKDNLIVAYLSTETVSLIYAVELMNIGEKCGKKIGRLSRLPCDGTDLRRGAVVKREQDCGVVKPVTSHACAETR